MQTISPATASLLAAGDLVIHTRVLWDPYTWGSAIDLRDFCGRDWVISIGTSETVDNPVPTLSLVLQREQDGISLAPWMTRSVANASGVVLELKSAVTVDVAFVAAGATPATADWVTIFVGTVTTIDVGASTPTITVSAVGLLGALNQMMETSDIYGSATPPGQAMEDAIQDILDDHLASAPTLSTPVSPSYYLSQWQQSKTSVLDAVTQIAGLIGWRCRYVGNTLTLYQPPRIKTTPDYTFTETQILDFAPATIDISGIRTKVTGIYTDATTGERASYTSQDSGAQALYGVIYMEVTEEAAKQIDSASEMQAMTDAILADLKDPAITGSLKVCLFPFAQIDDLYRVPPNGLQFDNELDVAIVGVAHKIAANEVTTTLQVRGAPTAGWARWLAIEARRGVSPAAKVESPTTPTTVTAEATLGALHIAYDEPTDPDWAYSECHLSVSSGFTPSDATLVSRTRATKFTIGGLVPNETYYVKIIAVDKYGNRSAASSQATTAAALVGPDHTDFSVDRMNLVPNGEFLITSPEPGVSAKPPDDWECVWVDLHQEAGPQFYFISEAPNTTSWGTGILLDDTYTESGDYAIQFNEYANDSAPSGDTVVAALRSKQYIPITSAAQPYWYGASFRVDTYSSGNVYMGVLFYDANHVCVQTYGVDLYPIPWVYYGGDTTDTWFSRQIYFNPPADARYMRIMVWSFNSTSQDPAWIDRVYVTKALGAAKVHCDSDQLMASGTPEQMTGDTVYTRGLTHSSSSGIIQAARTGRYDIVMRAVVDGATSANGQALIYTRPSSSDSWALEALGDYVTLSPSGETWMTCTALRVYLPAGGQVMGGAVYTGTGTVYLLGDVYPGADVSDLTVVEAEGAW
jgi:hypothetical protein